MHAARSDANIGSVTAWSNNVSIYSLPNADPDGFLAQQDRVSWVADSLARDYAGVALDVPAGISFSMLIPTHAIRAVGLMDPVFGRGYCEETDWSLRSLAAGYRICLAPAAFVYHQGRGSSVAAGMLQGNLTTVPVNEAIIDYRYPLFRDQVDTFVHGGILSRLHRDARHRLVGDAARQFGTRLNIASVAEVVDPNRVTVSWQPQQPHLAAAHYAGFSTPILLRGRPLVDAVDAFVADRDPPPSALDGPLTLPVPAPVAAPAAHA